MGYRIPLHQQDCPQLFVKDELEVELQSLGGTAVMSGYRNDSL